MMNYLRCFLLIVILLLSCPALIWANEFRLVPSIAAKEEYNDNIMFLPDDIRRDFITTISPSLELVNNTEKIQTDLLARLDRYDYIDNRDFSATDQLYKSKLRYVATPMFSITGEAGYSRDSQPGRDISTTGIILSAVPRKRINASVSSDYQFDEKTGALVSYAYNKDDYESTNFVNYASHNVNAGLVHDLGQYFQGLKGRVNLGYSNYLSSDTRIDNVIGTLGISRDFSELWSIQVDGGIRHTWSGVSSGQLQTNSNGWGWVGDISLIYKGERGNGSLAYNRDVTPASGLNGAVERNTLTLSAQYRMTEELSIISTAGYYMNKSDAGEFSTQSIDQRTFSISPGMRYEFSKDITLEALYDYTKIDYLTSNTAASRNLLSIRLYFQFKLLE